METLIIYGKAINAKINWKKFYILYIKNIKFLHLFKI